MNIIKTITCTALLIVLTLGSGYAQVGTGSGQRFYYAYEKRIALTPLADKAVIRVKEGEQLELNSLLRKSSLNSGDYTIEPLGKRTFQLNSAANSVSHLMNRMKGNQAIHTLQPVYTTQGGTELGVTDEIVVEFLAGVTPKQKEQLHRSLGVTVKKSKKYYDILSVATHGDALAVANAYQESGLVKYAHPNFLVKAQPDEYFPNDEYFSRQFYLHNLGSPWQIFNDGRTGTFDADVDAPEAWEISKGNPDIVVAIHDLGVSLDHPDLEGQFWINSSEDLNGNNKLDPGDSNGVDDDGNGYVDDVIGWDFNGINDGDGDDPYGDNDPSPGVGYWENNHGNACAGIVAAKQDNHEGVSGIAPLCKIMPLRRGTNSVEVTDDADAIDYAWENGADVFSQSFHYDENADWFANIVAAIERATTLGRDGKGMVLCFSTGNKDNHAGTVYFPANVDIAGVLAVGASNRYDQQANYSPTDPRIDIVATSSHSWCGIIPEEDNEIWTIDIPGNAGDNPQNSNSCHANEELPNSGTNHLAYTGRFGGTSAATPLVAGIAALVLSVDPDLTQLEVYFLLTQTADKVGGYNYVNGRCDEMGFGRVNAFNALNALSQSENLFLQNIIVETGQQKNWFALNSITAAGPAGMVQTVFIVASDGSATLTAGERISLKPGFIAHSGSQFYAGVAGAGQIARPLSSTSTGSSLLKSNSKIYETDNSNEDNKELAGNGSENSLQGLIPVEFSLSQNYPNPFNPTTTIKYALKEDVKVSLKIYNMLGQEVRTLVEESQSAGFREVVWDGKNDFGQQAASGVYLYRIVADNYIQTRRMVLLK